MSSSSNIAGSIRSQAHQYGKREIQAEYDSLYDQSEAILRYYTNRTSSNISAILTTLRSVVIPARFRTEYNEMLGKYQASR